MQYAGRASPIVIAANNIGCMYAGTVTSEGISADLVQAFRQSFVTEDIALPSAPTSGEFAVCVAVASSMIAKLIGTSMIARLSERFSTRCNLTPAGGPESRPLSRLVLSTLLNVNLSQTSPSLATSQQAGNLAYVGGVFPLGVPVGDAFGEEPVEEGIAQLLRRCYDGLGALYRLIDGVQDLGDGGAVRGVERRRIRHG